MVWTIGVGPAAPATAAAAGIGLAVAMATCENTDRRRGESKKWSSISIMLFLLYGAFARGPTRDANVHSFTAQGLRGYA